MCVFSSCLENSNTSGHEAEFLGHIDEEQRNVVPPTTHLSVRLSPSLHLPFHSEKLRKRFEVDSRNTYHRAKVHICRRQNYSGVIPDYRTNPCQIEQPLQTSLRSSQVKSAAL